MVCKPNKMYSKFKFDTVILTLKFPIDQLPYRATGFVLLNVTLLFFVSFLSSSACFLRISKTTSAA